MRTFAEYRRQPDFGCTVDHEFDAWFIAPFARHRDSDTLQRSNWETGVDMLKAAEPEDADDYRILRFDHWAVGWVEIVIVRPESKCATVAAEAEESLADYPLLDEEHHSSLEWTEYGEAWERYGRKNFVDGLKKQFRLSPIALDRLENAPSDNLQTFFEGLIPSGDYYSAEGDGVYPRIEYAIRNCTRADLAEFLLQLRKAPV